MSAKSFRKMVVLALALVCISAGYVQADKLALQEKLSKDVKIQLKDVTIAEALGKIGGKAGVKFVLSDEAVWKLPQGVATRLSVALDGPLAESMTEMLNAFFMRYAMGDEEITIYPRPELEHILSRPTVEQLELLRAIYTRPIVEYVETTQKTINETLGMNVVILPDDIQTGQIDPLLHSIAGREWEWPRSENPIFALPSPVTVATLLNQVDIYDYDYIRKRKERKEGRWYIAGMEFPNQMPEIRVVSSTEFREAKLDQIVDISFKDEKEGVVLQRLAKWVGMEVVINKGEPSWLGALISVDMQNIKLRHALRNIVSTIDGDISFDISDNEIDIIGPMHTQKVTRPTPASAPRATRRGSVVSEGYVGKISIPMDGGKYYIEFMLREKDLTEELKQLREKKMKEILGEKESKPKIKKNSSD